MKTLCITGPLQSQIDFVATQFQNNGMGMPHPVTRDTVINLDAWHDKVFATQPNKARQFALTAPGRLWEQLAGDIFIANIDQDCWGWADTRSMKLLDFWHDFEAGTRFILVCATPEEMLAQAIENTDTSVDPELILQEWQAAHREMLRFHLRHPERSLLIWGQDCVNAPSELTRAATKQWELSLEQPPGQRRSIAPNPAD